MSLRLVRSPFAPKMVMAAEATFFLWLLMFERCITDKLKQNKEPAQRFSRGRLRYLIYLLLGFPNIIRCIRIRVPLVRIDGHQCDLIRRGIMEFPDGTVHPYFHG